MMPSYAEYERSRRVRRFRVRMFIYAVAGVAFVTSAGRVMWADHRREPAPEWAVLVAAQSPLLPVAVVVGSIQSERRRKRLARFLIGRCQRCGYELKGNESGICPECGTQVCDA